MKAHLIGLFCLITSLTVAFAQGQNNDCSWMPWESDGTNPSLAVSMTPEKPFCKNEPVNIGLTITQNPGARKRICDHYDPDNGHDHIQYDTTGWIIVVNSVSYEYVNQDTGLDIGSGTLANDATNFCITPEESGKYSISISVNGTATDPAYTPENPATATSDIDVECCACANGPCGEGDGEGSLSTQNYSVFVRLGLGKFANGRKNYGYLQIHENTYSAGLATRQALKYVGMGEGIQKIVDGSGYLRQVKFDNGLVDLVDLAPGPGYEIMFYRSAGTLSGSIYVPTGDPAYKFKVEPLTGATSGVIISELKSAVFKKVAQYEWIQASSSWDLKTGWEDDVVFKRCERVGKTIAGTKTRELIEDGQAISRKREIYETFTWGEKLVREDVFINNTEYLSTIYEYYNDSSINKDKLKKVINADGSWVWNVYDSNRLLTHKYSSFSNEPPTTVSALCRLTHYEYSALGGGDNGTVRPSHPRTVTESLLGNNISRTYYIIKNVDGGMLEIQERRCQSPAGAWDSNDNLITTTRTYSSGENKDEVASINYPDGSMETNIYTIAAGSRIIERSVGLPDGGHTQILEGTKTVTHLGAAGQTIGRTNMVFNSDGTKIISSETYSDFDGHQRPRRVDFQDGTYETRQYDDCCGLTSITDRAGTTTGYGYDSLKRLETTTRDGIMTINRYDVAGQVYQVIRRGTNGNEIALKGTGFDWAGRVVTETNALGGVSSYTYVYDGTTKALTKTITYPNGGTRIEEYYRDGSLKQVSGTAATPVKYVHGIENNQAFTLEVKLTSTGGTNEWLKTFHDLLGRSYKTVYAGSGANLPYRFSYYNNLGQMVKQADPDSVTSLFAFNAKGEQTDTALDLDADDVLDYGGSDRITRVTNDVVVDGSTLVHRSRTYVWPTNDSASPLLVSTSLRTITNAQPQSWSTSFGLTNRQLTRYLGEGRVLSTNWAPDNSYRVSLALHGRILGVTNFDSNNAILTYATNEYDPHGRLWQITDARNGATTNSYNDADQVVIVSSPPSATGQPNQSITNYYSNMGLLTGVGYADGTTVTNEYYLNGQLKKTYGSRTYPVEYTYDAQGRMKTMVTWRSFSATPSGAATTTWNYDQYRGWLESKRYHDNNGVDYTYTAGGRLETRTWARSNGANRITTTYTYGHGDMTGITYSDATPASTFTYDRQGRLSTVARDSMTTTMLYNNASQLLSESYNGGILSGQVVTNHYDSLLRRDLNQVIEGATLKYSVGYEYDEASRLQTVAWGDAFATYSYLDKSSLLSSILHYYNNEWVMVNEREYDSLNRLTFIRSTTYQFQAASFTYTYNQANQRTKATTENNGQYWDYGYDALGQLTDGTKHNADETPINDRQFGYTFDTIGNRTATESNAVSGTYVPNALNQYDSRTIDGNAETFTPDADGNLLQDAVWDYTWDAENRLIKMVTRTGATPERWIEFKYDYRGRRIQKQVWNNRTKSGDPVSAQRFVYDGWNLAVILDDSHNVNQAFVWGLDLSGSLQGAGGVGGLLMRSNATQGLSLVAYDGNGNVVGLVAAANGDLTTRYEYGPFGELLSATGPVAAANPFRFSTKYQDDESSLLYYGHRYYNPSTGRWLSRDPLEERGGKNLYEFVVNNPVAAIDVNGLLSATGVRWIKQNCREVSLGYSLAVYDEIGFTLSAKVYGYKCDCYDCKTGITHKDDTWQIGLNTEIEAGFGLGVKLKVPILGQVGGVFKGPQMHFDLTPFSYEKECGIAAPHKHFEANIGTKWSGELNVGKLVGVSGFGANVFAGLVLDDNFVVDGEGRNLTIAVGVHLHGGIRVSGSYLGIEFSKQYLDFDMNPTINHTFSF